jgi:hypothetical protein
MSQSSFIYFRQTSPIKLRVRVRVRVRVGVLYMIVHEIKFVLVSMALDGNSMTPKAIESYKVAQFCASLNGMGTCDHICGTQDHIEETYGVAQVCLSLKVWVTKFVASKAPIGTYQVAQVCVSLNGNGVCNHICCTQGYCRYQDPDYHERVACQYQRCHIQVCTHASCYRVCSKGEVTTCSSSGFCSSKDIVLLYLRLGGRPSGWPRC